MGKLRLAIIFLLGLMLFGCGRGSSDLVVRPLPASTPAQTTPLARVQVVSEENLAEVVPPPELPISTRRLKVKPVERPRARRTSPLPRAKKAKPAQNLPPVKRAESPKRTTKTSGKASYPKADPLRIQIAKAEAASRTLDNLVQTGQVAADFHGTGSSHRMVGICLTNVSQHPVLVRLVPGMILNPPGYHAVQPLLTVEEQQFLLRRGQSTVAALQSYCMDSRVPAPAPGEPVDYRFSTRTKDGGPRAVRAYLVAQKTARSSPHLHAITQFAIWKALGQPTEEKHFQSLLGPLAEDQAVRDEVLRQVDKVLESL